MNHDFCYYQNKNINNITDPLFDLAVLNFICVKIKLNNSKINIYKYSI